MNCCVLVISCSFHLSFGTLHLKVVFGRAPVNPYRISILDEKPLVDQAWHGTPQDLTAVNFG